MYRSLGRHLGAARKKQERSTLDSIRHDKEERVINYVSYDDDARGWIASTSLVGDDGDINSDVDYTSIHTPRWKQ